MAEEPSVSYYLPIAGGRIIGFIPFPRVLVLCEMQSVSSRIWTRVAVSISYDDNHYTTGTSYTPRAPTNIACSWCDIATEEFELVHNFRTWTISLMNRVFANGLGDQGSIFGRVIPKTQKMVPDAALLNTQ